ncbi:ATP-binding cassette domain-containing protein [Cryomorphaceae bacterium 1068]|nr:ATP-binding cassette domain-containing protein [Cryomorphaceae bacterium 1068]
MFEIDLKKAGKRYNSEWIFKNLSATFRSGSATVILGGNGSGKSTALRSVFGYAPLSSGEIAYQFDGKNIKQSEAYKYFSICAPYLELYEELTLEELAKFHFSLKPALPKISIADFSELIDLKSAADKPVKYFSSGMKQRVRIGLAMMSDVKAIYFDEPTSNLDRKAIDWYRSTIEEFRMDRIILVASNQQEDEYFFCDEKIEIEKFKPI